MQKFPVPEKYAHLFVSQKDDYSCGPACMATLAKLYGVSTFDYDSVRKDMRTNPIIGTTTTDMIDAVQKHLPFANAGEGVYSGGIAIGLIFTGEAHYVVLLERQDEVVIYYDPYDHTLVKTNIADIDWRSDTENLQNFAITLKPPAKNPLDLSASTPVPAKDNNPKNKHNFK